MFSSKFAPHFRMLVLLIASIIIDIGLANTIPVKADTLTFEATGHATATGTGRLVLHRDIFRHGGWEITNRSPNPYAQTDGTLRFSSGNTVPIGSTLLSANLSWAFSNLTAVTHWSQVSAFEHGSSRPCGLCLPASIERFAAEGAVWSGYVVLDNVGIYWFSTDSNRAQSGSIDLLSIWTSEQLASHDLSFIFTVQYGLGRPFFRTEAWNADTTFLLSGNSSVAARGILNISFAPPAQPTAVPAEVPEPVTLLLLGTGLVGLAGSLRKRRQR